MKNGAEKPQNSSRNGEERAKESSFIATTGLLETSIAKASQFQKMMSSFCETKIIFSSLKIP